MKLFFYGVCFTKNFLIPKKATPKAKPKAQNTNESRFVRVTGGARLTFAN